MSTKTFENPELSLPDPEAPQAPAQTDAFETPLGWAPPNAETFSFESYISGNSTFPTFEHTVYLDQARGYALQGLIEKYEELTAKRQGLLEEQSSPRSRSASLVSDFAENLSEDIEVIESELTELGSRMALLETEIKKTSMTLTFQLSNIDRLTSVTRSAERAFLKKHGKGGGEDDFNHTTLKGRYVLLAQLDEFCTKVTSASGNPITKPTQDGFSLMLDRLVPSESVRLLIAINRGLDSSASWASRVDAGFPGGGADLG